jgi:nucleoid-associated protein YgaU
MHALLKAYGGRLPPYVRRYIVKRGDTLTRIAAKFDLFEWQDIYQANSFRIRNPNLIYPGQVLAIP